jgi:hypothetical protein
MKTITSSGLKGEEFDVCEIIRRAADAGDFVTVTGMIEDHNFDPKSEKKMKDAQKKNDSKRNKKPTVQETAKKAREAAKLAAGIVVPPPVSPHRDLLCYVIECMKKHFDLYSNIVSNNVKIIS